MINKQYQILAALALTAFSMNAQSEPNWTNLFPRNELGEVYVINAQQDHEEAPKLFDVKKSRIEVLYNWPDGKAPFGMITTTATYSRFNLEFKYRWGKRKFAPRDSVKRDAGVLFHVNGPKKIWPSSLECQVQEGDTGDLWVIKGPKVTVRNPDGTLREVNASAKKAYQRNIKFGDYEKEGWNHVRLEVRGANEARFYVNGNLVNEIADFVSKDGNPLDSGHIALQAEGAELIYKKIRIQNLE